LEVLFPAPEGKTIDYARSGLTKLGYDHTEMERDFIPAIVLRNNIDVGHAHLALFTQSELSTIHAYVDLAFPRFQELLTRVLEMTKSGDFEVPPYEVGPESKDVKAKIERMSERLKRCVPGI